MKAKNTKKIKLTDKVPYSIGNLSIKTARKMLKSLLPLVKNVF